MAKNIDVILIDCPIYIFKYYFSVQHEHLSVSGKDVATVLAFYRWLQKLLADIEPSQVAVCFDESLGSGFRHDIDPEYKANRVLPDDEILYIFLACKKICEALGLCVLASDRFEADDLIASAYFHVKAQGLNCSIISRDKDLGQLLNSDGDTLWDYPNGMALNAEAFYQKHGVRPRQFADYLAIVGDASDNIFGVQGVGAKTCVALLNVYESWEDIKSNLTQLSSLKIRGASGLQAKFIENADVVDKNLRLTRLDHHSVDWTKQNMKRRDIDRDTLSELFIEFNAMNIAQNL